MAREHAELQELLFDVLRQSSSDRGFASSDFYQEWFARQGTAYFFLFNKNLKVTNLQFAELVALLRTYIYSRDGDRKKELLFLSTRSFKDGLQEIVGEDDDPLTDRQLKRIAVRYASLLSRSIVMDLFFGSAAVFVPPHLEIDLARICGLSGYVNSCGRSVYIRSTEKLSSRDLYHKIDNHLTRFPSKKRVFLTAYAHEDFTKYDRDVADRLRHGLDDVKLHVEKFFVGGDRLPGVLAGLREQMAEDVFIPPAGDYHDAHARDRDVDEDRTLWLISDKGLGADMQPSGRRYLICYDQLYANNCPFQKFDENKPAWISHTTIPHSLLRAMLNITLPWPEGRVSVCDPFVGTGTTWLEALKFHEADAVCSDLEQITPLLGTDNLRFFTFAGDRLERIEETLKRWGTTRPSQVDGEEAGSEVASRGMELARAAVPDAADGASDESVPPSIIGELAEATFDERLAFYLGLRARRRYVGAYERDSLDEAAAFSREARQLSRQVSRLGEWRRAVSHDSVAPIAPKLVAFRGLYSREVSIDPEHLRELAESDYPRRSINIRDCRHLEADSVDILVADPPYGFNTSDSADDLAELYKEFLTAAVAALRHQGQFVLCLPEQSYTGRRLPVCSRKDLIVHQVLVAADELNREVIVPAKTFPTHGWFFRPPYYWEAEKALRRAILHFQIRHRLG